MREVTWARIGTDVSEKRTVSEVLEKAGLNYTVHKEKILIPNGTEIEGSVATVKSTGDICGIVSDKYSVYQNDEALDFVNNIPDIQFERAGETHKGMIYLIGKLPDLEVLGDKFTPHVIFQTSHNGNYPLKATICPLRFVCQNQFAWSFRQMRNHVTVRHSSLMPVKIAQAQVVINDTAQYMNGFTNTAEELALLHISDTTRHAIIDAFFDKKCTASKKLCAELSVSIIIKPIPANPRGKAAAIRSVLVIFHNCRRGFSTSILSKSLFS
jgi:hypothetical protein